MVVTSPKTQKLNFMLLLCGTCCKYNAQSSLKIFAQKYLCIGIDTYSILQKISLHLQRQFLSEDTLR